MKYVQLYLLGAIVGAYVFAWFYIQRSKMREREKLWKIRAKK